MKTIFIDHINTIGNDIRVLKKHKEDHKRTQENLDHIAEDWKIIQKDFDICWYKICELMENWRNSPTKKTSEEEEIINIFFEKYNGEYTCGKSTGIAHIGEE